MHDFYFNAPVFDDVAGCSVVCVTYEVTRETLIALDRNINGTNQSDPASFYSTSYKVLSPLFKNEKALTLINRTLESEDIVRNLMMYTHMMRNGLTYLTLNYKLKSQINLTYSNPLQNKFWNYIEPSLILNDCATLTRRIKQLSERILSALDAEVNDNPVFCAEIISNTEESYFNDDAQMIIPSSIIHRGQTQVEIHCTQFEQGMHSAFYVPVWTKLPFFGFYVKSGNTVDSLQTDRLGIDHFSTGAHICMSFYEKVNQDCNTIEDDVSEFFNKKNHSDLASLTLISSFSDRLHTVSEKITILLAAPTEQQIYEPYTKYFQTKLQILQHRTNELQSFIRARHPLKESLLQVEQIKTNKIFSIMFAMLAAVQIAIALISVDWTDSTSSNNIYKNAVAFYELLTS